MATDVKTNILPVAAPSTSPRPAPKSQAPSDGRAFAKELSRPDAQADVRSGAEQAKEAAERFQERLRAKVKEAAGKPEDQQKEKTVAEAAPATLDTKAFRNAARDSRQAIRNTDAVAFLSGRLEQIEPSEIASLVSDTPFIQQALGNGDVAAFMQAPVEAQKLFEALGVPDEVVAQIEASGIDLSETISPKEFLKSLGIDPDRMTTELINLAQALPIDGVQPYIERAARMQGKLENHDKPVQEPTVAGAAAVGKPKADVTTIAKETPAGSPLASAVSQMASPKSPAAVAPTVGEANPVATGVPTQPTPAAQPQLDQTAKTALAQANPLRGEGVGAQAPTMRSTSVDPFAEFAKSGNFQRVPLEGNRVGYGASETVDEALLQNNWKLGQDAVVSTPKNPGEVSNEAITGQLLQLTKNGQAMPQAQKGMVRPDQLVENMTQEDMDVSADGLWQKPKTMATAAMTKQSQMVMPTLVKDQIDSTSMPRMLDQRMPIEDLQLDASQWESFQQQGEEGGFDQGGDQGGFEFKGDAQMMGRLNAATGRSFETGESSFDIGVKQDAFALTPKERAQAVQQIMDRAVMMAKTGGGSVQLDLSSLNLGPIELAIQVAGNRVDMKIRSESDHIRHALAGDLAGLREALSAQNMTLASVDVGTDTRGEGQQPSFTGSGQFEQQSRDQAGDFEDHFAGSLGSIRRSLQKTIASNVRIPVVPPQAYSNGQLAVRV